MKLKITHELEEMDSDIAKRILFKDEAFGLLWDLEQAMRDYFKYGIKSKKNAELLMERMRKEIGESGLLDYYK